jgi:restriction endonuclease HindI-like protein
MAARYGSSLPTPRHQRRQRDPFKADAGLPPSSRLRLGVRAIRGVVRASERWRPVSGLAHSGRRYTRGYSHGRLYPGTGAGGVGGATRSRWAWRGGHCRKGPLCRLRSTLLFCQRARNQLRKALPGRKKKGAIEQAARDLVDDAVESEGVVDIFTAAGLPHAEHLGSG